MYFISYYKYALKLKIMFPLTESNCNLGFRKPLFYPFELRGINQNLKSSSVDSEDSRINSISIVLSSLYVVILKPPVLMVNILCPPSLSFSKQSYARFLVECASHSTSGIFNAIIFELEAHLQSVNSITFCTLSKSKCLMAFSVFLTCSVVMLCFMPAVLKVKWERGESNPKPTD